MIGHVLERSLRRALSGSGGKTLFPLLVGVMALGSTVTMSLPFAPILVFAVLLQPARAGRTVLAAALGSAVGGVLLYLMFHHWGWNTVIAKYPELVHGLAWREATAWLSREGVMALGVIAATPLPDTPGLLYAAIAHLSPFAIFLALLAGKLLKFSVYAAAAVKFPERFRDWFGEEGGFSRPRARSG